MHACLPLADDIFMGAPRLACRCDQSSHTCVYVMSMSVCGYRGERADRILSVIIGFVFASKRGRGDFTCTCATGKCKIEIFRLSGSTFLWRV